MAKCCKIIHQSGYTALHKADTSNYKCVIDIMIRRYTFYLFKLHLKKDIMTCSCLDYTGLKIFGRKLPVPKSLSLKLK